MALIAFCAIALVENVTNAHPVTREGGAEGGREGWKGSGREGRRAGGGGKTRKNKNKTKGLDTSSL